MRVLKFKDKVFAEQNIIRISHYICLTPRVDETLAHTNTARSNVLLVSVCDSLTGAAVTGTAVLQSLTWMSYG